jgi:hypothetical protein
MPLMTAHDYARFLELQGHRIRFAAGVYWFDVSRRFYLPAPHHREYELMPRDLEPLFSGWNCLGVRYAAPPTYAAGRMSYQIVCDHRDYGLGLLSANVRSKVRRGLKRCEVGPADLSVLEAEGQVAHRDTLRRQRREDAWSEEQWRRFWQAARVVPGVEGWAAWVDGRLAAFLVTVTFEDAVEFLLARSCSDERNAYPNNALIYTVTEEMLVRRRAPQITFGLESLEPVKPLDEFKFSMGFRPKPIRQVVVFHPLLRALFANRYARAGVLRWLEQRGEKGVFWRKAAGLLRFADEAEGRPPQDT